MVQVAFGKYPEVDHERRPFPVRAKYPSHRLIGPISLVLLGLLACVSSRADPSGAAVPTESPVFRFQISPESGVLLNASDETRAFSYTVETSDALGAGAVWAPAPAEVWPRQAATWSEGGRMAQPQRYYRAVAGAAAAERGQLISATRVDSLSTAEIRAGFALIGLTVEVGTGVHMDKLVYETINPFGLRTIASGLVVYPDQRTNAAPLVSYQHGTIVMKDEVPSAEQGLDRLVGIALGTTGYVTAMSDYIGLGDSPGLHPYVHARSEASAAIDLLRAARTYCATNSIALNNQLFLIGYSEGGHATMATHRELETQHTNEFKVTASAPMAGPYDLSGTMANDFLSGRSMGSPYYFLYLVAAYQSIYHLAPSLAEIFISPYDRLLPPLLDGLHDGGELDQAMGTRVPIQILKPEFLAAFRADPNHPLWSALKENDLYNWTPTAPIRLFHCAGDQDVLFANSKVAYESLRLKSAAEVKLVDPMPSATHGTCAPVAFLGAKAWFDSIAER